MSAVMQAMLMTIESELMVQESATSRASLKHMPVKIVHTAETGAKAMTASTAAML